VKPGNKRVLAEPAGETGKEEPVAKFDTYVERELAIRYAHDGFELYR
jgi:hypothetical protein